MATETITVLFTDLVGSTALLSRVGQAEAEALRREHFGLLRTALATHGGREVKNLGDGLMVAFASVSASVACAVEMQQAMYARSTAREPLAIRIGIAVGEADLEDGDYFGLPIVEAARLCARAEGGEILTTEFVWLLGRARIDARFESIGALELKGIHTPLETYRVKWVPRASVKTRPPLPARLVSSIATNFVGRVDEHDRLATEWKRVGAHGEQRVMLVAGEPGIGKTTLAARIASEVYDQGAVVLYGRCDEDLGIPYQPWFEALTPLVAHASVHTLAEHVANRGEHLARLVPELAQRVPIAEPAGVDADTERFVLFGCVADLLERVSSDHAVLVVLDDLHWADRASLQLLRHVATSERGMAVGLLGTFRDSDIAADHPVAELLATLHREGGAERIVLGGLSDDDLLLWLEHIAGHEMGDDGLALRDAVLQETNGNPFFVGEIVRHLAESGVIYQRDDGRWVGDVDVRTVGLPVSVKEVIGRRVGALGPDTERVLALGAVIGREFDVRFLAAVAKVDEDALVDLCDRAVAAAVLQETDVDRYSFAHALIEYALYDGLSAARRSRAHRAVAEQLEMALSADPGDRAGELAYHWAAAVQPSDVLKAVHYAEVAAARALEQLAPDEALRWYTQALELLTRSDEHDVRRRAEILIGLGDAQRQCGVPAHRETLLEAADIADQLDAVDLFVRAVLTDTRTWNSMLGRTDHARIALIDRALARLEDADNPDRARLLALACVERIYSADLDERLELAEAAVATARRSGDVDALAYVLTRVHEPISVPSTIALRTAWTTEACTIADANDNAATRWEAHVNRRLTALDHADFETFAAHDAIVEDIVTRIPHAALRWNAAFHRVETALLRGDLPEAERLAEVAFTLGAENGQADALALYGAQLMAIRYHQGRFHEMSELVEQAIVDSPEQLVYHPTLAASYAFSSARDRASELLDEHLAGGLAMTFDLSWLAAHESWAIAAVRVGHRDVAEVVHQRLTPYDDQLPSSHSSVLPVVAEVLGRLDHLLGRYDDADRRFAQAMAMHTRLHSPLLVASTSAAWAALLADRGAGDDAVRAWTLAQAALTAATAGGYGYTEADARAVLGRLPR